MLRTTFGSAAFLFVFHFMQMASTAHAQTVGPSGLPSSELAAVARQADTMLKEFFKTLDSRENETNARTLQLSLLKYWHFDLSTSDSGVARLLPSTAVASVPQSERDKLAALVAEVYRNSVFGRFQELRSKQIDLLRMALDFRAVPTWIASRSSVDSLTDETLKSIVDEKLGQYGITKDLAADLLSRELSFEITSIEPTFDRKGKMGYIVTVLMVPELTKALIRDRRLLPELGIQSVDHYYVRFTFLPVRDHFAEDGFRLKLWEHSLAGINMQQLLRHELASVNSRGSAINRLEETVERWNLGQPTFSVESLVQQYKSIEASPYLGKSTSQPSREPTLHDKL